MSGFQYVDDEFENFARSSESRKDQFAQLRQGLDASTQAGGSPFGRMPWSGGLQSAYEHTRSEILAMAESATDVMQVIADNIRTTRDHYQAAEVDTTSQIEKLGQD